jgi:hypothetical protein
MHIYTLSAPLDGEKSILNGRLLLVRIDKNDKRLKIADAITREDIWVTTPIFVSRESDVGACFVTQSGSTYDFVNVEALIPTTKVFSNTSEDAVHEEEPTVDFVVVNCEESHRPIYYGDGYDKYVFEFSREINEAEFLAFLKKEGRPTNKQEHMFQDYAKLQGKGTKWTYTWVRCYTD